MNRNARRTLACIVAFLPACGNRSDGPQRTPQGYLYEKGPYQAMYGSDGRIIRLLYDGNGDKKADLVTEYYPTGRPHTATIDEDYDGVIDRWEYFLPKGALEKVGVSPHKKGRPERWDFVDAKHGLVRREHDEDTDGTVERVEQFKGGVLVRHEIDSDRDGRIDRWQTVEGGRVVREDIDTDRNSVADRTIRFDRNGRPLGMEILAVAQAKR
jgi:hypothetical protein